MFRASMLRNESIRHRVLLVQQPHHLILVHEEDDAVRDRGRTPHANGLTRQASFAKEVAGSQHRDDRLSPRLREHRELHSTLLNVQDALTGVALGEDDLGSPILHDLSRDPRGTEKRLDIERAFFGRFHGNTPGKHRDRWTRTSTPPMDGGLWNRVA
jgi:hypothetical protein